MPNYCKSVLFFKGEAEDIRRLRREVGSQDYVIDFNKLIPMPLELSITSGSETAYSFAAYCLEQGATPPKEYKACAEYLKERYNEERKPNEGIERYLRRCSRKHMHEVDLELGRQVASNIERFGAPTWYEWCIQNWGTKWNACECEEEGDSRIAFQTAWAPPDPVFDEVARRYPKVSFSCYSVDEGDPYRTWVREYKDGVLTGNRVIKDPELVGRIWAASGQPYKWRWV